MPKWARVQRSVVRGGRVRQHNTHYTIPNEALDHNVTAVVMAVAVGATSTREVAKMTGRSLQITLRDMRRARELGLIDWEDQRDGTLRPKVVVVAHGAR